MQGLNQGFEQASYEPSYLCNPITNPKELKMLILNSVSGSGVWRTGGSERGASRGRDVMGQDTAFGVAHTRMPWCSPVVRRDGDHGECLGYGGFGVSVGTCQWWNKHFFVALVASG